jgi:hypothetical protein
MLDLFSALPDAGPGALACSVCPLATLPRPGTVYLLHFEQPIGNPDKAKGQARHYLGWTSDLPARVASHTSRTRPMPGCGTVAKIVAYVQREGIGFRVARTWVGGRGLERRLKNRRNAPRLCPLCKET